MPTKCNIFFKYRQVNFRYLGDKYFWHCPILSIVVDTLLHKSRAMQSKIFQLGKPAMHFLPDFWLHHFEHFYINCNHSQIVSNNCGLQLCVSWSIVFFIHSLHAFQSTSSSKLNIIIHVYQNNISVVPKCSVHILHMFFS